VENSSAFGLEFPTDMRLAYELAPCQDWYMDGQIYWDKRESKNKSKSKSKKQKILGKVKIEKKNTSPHRKRRREKKRPKKKKGDPLKKTPRSKRDGRKNLSHLKKRHYTLKLRKRKKNITPTLIAFNALDSGGNRGHGNAKNDTTKRSGKEELNTARARGRLTAQGGGATIPKAGRQVVWRVRAHGEGGSPLPFPCRPAGDDVRGFAPDTPREETGRASAIREKQERTHERT
jgi:hypothetical protein